MVEAPSSQTVIVGVQRRSTGALKSKDVFIEPRRVRCVWSLMSPVTFMWHDIKCREADKLRSRAEPVLAGRFAVMWQQELQYCGRNLPSGMMWRWVRRPPSLSANSALQRRKWSEPWQRELCAYSSKLFKLGRTVLCARLGLSLSSSVHKCSCLLDGAALCCMVWFWTPEEPWRDQIKAKSSLTAPGEQEPP